MRNTPKVVKLGNLTVVLVKDQKLSVTVMAMLGSGSREESDKEAGSAHFLEHFVFKGTRLFPQMYDINTAVENVGGAFNAYTGQNEMGFWVKMDKTHLPLAARIVGQLVTEPILPQTHIDKERGTILEELHMYEDRPNSKAAEEMEKLLYGETNLGRPIIGAKESLKTMSVDDLRQYFNKWFVAKNIVVGVVGDYGDEEDVLELIRNEFALLVNDKRALPKKDVFSWDEQSDLRKRLITKKLDQASVFVGFRGVNLFSKHRWTLELVNIILGDSWLSRMLKEVREERGWAYSIRSGVNHYQDVGDVMIGAGLKKGKLTEAVELIKEICFGLSKNGEWQITDEELAIAKDCFRGRLALEYDVPEEVLGSALGGLLFEDKIHTPEEILKRVDNVGLQEVYEVCDLVFRPENMSVAVVGDYKVLEF